MQSIYNRLERVNNKIETCERFLQGIEIGEHPAFLKVETEQDLRYWQTELRKLQTCPHCNEQMERAEYLEGENSHESEYICMNDECSELIQQ